jgi:hypothetical protein
MANMARGLLRGLRLRNSQPVDWRSPGEKPLLGAVVALGFASRLVTHGFAEAEPTLKDISLEKLDHS